MTNLFAPYLAFSETTCNSHSNPLNALPEMPIFMCQKTRESPQCQKLYKSIKESGNDPNEKALRCEVDTDLTLNQIVSVSLISCLKGGIVDGFIGPIQDMGKLLGESTARAVIELKRNNQRLQLCNQDLNAKMGIFKTYNSAVPRLMKLDIPINLATKSCAQIEHELYSLSNQRENILARSIDFKHFQKNPHLNQDEAEYLKWKFEKFDNFVSSNHGLSEMADQILRSYGVQIECYNLETRAALRCEILFSIVSNFGVAKTAVNLLSGMKSGLFLKLIKTEPSTIATMTKRTFDRLPDTDELILPSLAAKLRPVDSTFRNPNLLHFFSRHADISVATIDGRPVMVKTMKTASEARNYEMLKKIGLANHYRGVTRQGDGGLIMVSDFIDGPLIKCPWNCRLIGSLEGVPVGDHTWKEFDRIGRILDENGIQAVDLQFIISKKTGLPVLIDPEQFNFLGKKIKSLSFTDAQNRLMLKKKSGRVAEELDINSFPPEIEERLAAASSSKSMTDYYSEIIQREMKLVH